MLTKDNLGMPQSKECRKFLEKLKVFMDESGWSFTNGELAVFQPETKEEMAKRNEMILEAQDCFGEEYVKEQEKFFNTFKVYNDA